MSLTTCPNNANNTLCPCIERTGIEAKLQMSRVGTVQIPHDPMAFPIDSPSHIHSLS